MSEDKKEGLKLFDKSRDSLMSLPIDVIKYLLLTTDDVKSVVKLLSTNKTLNKIDKDQDFWKKMYEKHIGIPKTESTDFRADFIQAFTTKHTLESEIIKHITPLHNKAKANEYGAILSGILVTHTSRFVEKQSSRHRQLTTIQSLLFLHDLNSQIPTSISVVPNKLPDALLKVRSLDDLKFIGQQISALMSKSTIQNDIAEFFKQIGIKDYTPNMDPAALEKEIGEIVKQPSPKTSGPRF